MHLLWTSALGANAGQKNRTIERIEARRVVQRSADDYADIARLASLCASTLNAAHSSTTP